MNGFLMMIVDLPFDSQVGWHIMNNPSAREHLIQIHVIEYNSDTGFISTA